MKYDDKLSLWEETPCIVYTAAAHQTREQSLSPEIETEIYANGSHLGTLFSSPHDIETLAIGYCLHNGYSGKHATVRCEENAVYVEWSGNISKAAQAPFIPVSAAELCQYGGLLDRVSAAHHRSHGVHEGAFVRNGTVLAYEEDVSRHNVLDRLGGTAFLNHLDVSQAIFVFSGRVPASIVMRVRRLGIRFIAARALPTTRAVELAKAWGITLVCALRTDSFRVFAHDERIKW